MAFHGSITLFTLIQLQNIISPLSPEPKGGAIYQYPANCCFVRLPHRQYYIICLWKYGLKKKRSICILLPIISKFALCMYFKRVIVLGFTCATCFRIWQLLVFNTFMLVKLQKLSSLYKDELFLIYLLKQDTWMRDKISTFLDLTCFR